MINRERVYWSWIDPALHCRSHEERLSNGTFLNVQVRLSTGGKTQLFLGAYDAQGAMLFEESFDSRAGETMTQAMEWGILQAQECVGNLATHSTAADKPEQAHQTGSRKGE
ncbi:hypothetical protein [Pseudomonas sp. SG20052]|uniref:hypothetical protein n=1 Tax=Pseudomonas sp. SG20052 TaxID=3074147 RepID=UPI00287F9420|nr:hypothetical protein [Pseudomonas sp. SG20052]WNF52974.1 hypothetical protein RHP74_16505 [Pseudomonas sp. SG20052]